MEKIIIHTDRDLTPKGKRKFLVVRQRWGNVIKWYVSGKTYRKLAVTRENLALSVEWSSAQPGLMSDFSQ